MYMLLEKYMNSLDIEKLNNLAKQNDLELTDEELKFTYNFVKKNWNTILGNPSIFKIDKYKIMYSTENFIKIKKLYNNALNKYSHLLK